MGPSPGLCFFTICVAEALTPHIVRSRQTIRLGSAPPSNPNGSNFVPLPPRRVAAQIFSHREELLN